MKKRYLWAGLLSLVVAVALVAGACAGGETTTTEQVTTTVSYPVGTSSGPIKVGHIFDETGNEAIVGSLFNQAIEYVLTDTSVAGRPIQLVNADSKSTTEGAVEAARKLIEQDGVDIVFGPTQIGQKNAVATYCAEKQVPMVLYNPTPPGPLEDNEWVIGVGGLTAQYATVIADYMYKDLAYKSISTLGPEDSSGHAFFEPLVEYFTALGGEVQQQWAVGQTDDWSAYLTTVEQVDALCAWVGGSGIPLLVAYYDTGVYTKIPLVGAFHGGFLDPWIPKNIGEVNKDAARSLIGIKTVMAWNPENASPVNTDYVKGFTALGPWKAEDGGPSGAVQAGMVLLKALRSLAPRICRTCPCVTPFWPSTWQAPKDGCSSHPVTTSRRSRTTSSRWLCRIAASHPEDLRDLFEYKLVKTYADVPPHGLRQVAARIVPHLTT